MTEDYTALREEIRQAALIIDKHPCEVYGLNHKLRLAYDAIASLERQLAEVRGKRDELDGECQQSMLTIYRERDRAATAEDEASALRASLVAVEEALRAMLVNPDKASRVALAALQEPQT